MTSKDGIIDAIDEYLEKSAEGDREAEVLSLATALVGLLEKKFDWSLVEILTFIESNTDEQFARHDGSDHTQCRLSGRASDLPGTFRRHRQPNANASASKATDTARTGNASAMPSFSAIRCVPIVKLMGSWSPLAWFTTSLT